MNPMVMMALSQLASTMIDKFAGSPGESKSTYNKGQLSLIDQATQAAKGRGIPQGIGTNPQYGQANDWLMSMFNDPEFFNAFEAPMQRQFQEQTIPDLINRFASQGSTGGQSSSAFRNQLAREGSNLHTNIAAMRGQMQQNAIPQLFQSSQMPMNEYSNILNSILGHPTQNVYQGPTSPGSNIVNPMLQYYMMQQTQPKAGGLSPGQNPITG